MRRRALGVLTVVIVTAVAAGTGAVLVFVCESSDIGWVVLVICATPGLAQRSLYQHVAAVAQPLEAGDLNVARTAVAMVVGRDTAGLDESGVATAAIESLAESFNDGIVAPAFWLLLGGLPGLFAYKAINTADSLIGHMEPRWREFGWAAARTDDWANWIPARIAGLLIAAAAGRGLSVMLRDARKHASPNAGWPEAAMAGALALRLGGPASYDGQTHVRPWFGDGSRASPPDLRAAMSLYVRACVALWILLAVMAAALRLTNAQ
jgi:adenosylcobinamide-phosphate synthase